MIYSASSQDSETAALNPPAFIDQWPCRPGLRRQYEHSDGIVDVLNEAVALALQQLRVTIIASLGFQPSACCRSNFHGSMSMARSEYIKAIGEPAFTPQYFAIHIPRLYPGFPAHKGGDHNMLRLMFITWVRTMLLLDSYCEYVSTGKRTPPPVTREFHEGVLERLREREQQSDLAQRLCEARNVVEQSLSSTGRDQLAARRLKDEILSGMTGETYSELMSNLGRLTAARKMERYGVTQGLPFSRQRWAQCYDVDGYSGGTEWINDPDFCRELISQEMRRVRRAATSQNQSHVQQNIIYIFTMAQVKVNNVGRAIPSVYTDDQRREHRRELDGIFIGIAHSGTRYLDFDPDVCIYGLIRTEWEAHEGQRFQYSRMLRLYLDQVIVPAGGRVMVSTSPDATDVPYLHIQMLELMARIMTVGMESLLTVYFPSRSRRIKIEPDKLLPRKAASIKHQTMVNGRPSTYRVWDINMN
ncbi:hypothetical protein VTP01DRAFT_2845 [Rhizomucor pusillus]|uniref:uncharacterized protein n=1 Tax=Rhizomucor pusillus TaxID=4840 RepID=UPI0037427771